MTGASGGGRRWCRRPRQVRQSTAGRRARQPPGPDAPAPGARPRRSCRSGCCPRGARGRRRRAAFPAARPRPRARPLSAPGSAAAARPTQRLRPRVRD
ncbi:MAG TPA: hypothetical protein DEP66_07330 [Acidimicrobiaceae bacterium]|nr:hypothetical protein [Acidimicrobiaceae bacterium]HCB37988.1 hypothetical protein [Acidimicrobiaceae bacterium]